MDTQTPLGIMATFTADNPPTLDVAVLAALDYAKKRQAEGCSPHFPRLTASGRLIGVGSGNGANTAAILIGPHDSTAADESDIDEKLAKADYVEALVVSASGEKDAPDVIAKLRAKGIFVHLLTCNSDSTGAKSANLVTEFPLGREPISYNVMTYLSMVMASTGEKAEDILAYLERISHLIKGADFATRRGVIFILPPRFKQLKSMLETKFVELFGPYISYYGCTSAFASRHIISLVQHPEAIFINLDPDFDPLSLKLKCGHKNIPLPLGCGWGMAIAVGYWLVGQIQRQNEPWFAQSVVAYCQDLGKQPIVE